MKIFFTSSAWLGIAVFIILSILVVYSLLSPEQGKHEKTFIAKVEEALKKNGDWAMVSSLYPGNWERVCINPSVSTGGTLDRKIVAEKFGVSPESLKLPDGIISSSDWNWSLMFFYPPSTVKFLKISNKNFFGTAFHKPKTESYECPLKKEAVFKRQSFNDQLIQYQIVLTRLDE